MRVALLLFPSAEAARATTPKQAEAELDAYQAVPDRLAAAGVLRGGEAFVPADTAHTVRVLDGASRTEPGPATGGDLELAGLYVLEVEDEQEALAWAERMPVATHGAVEVRPLMPWPSPGPSGEAAAH